MDRPPAIELRGLYRHFGERTVLRDVSLQVPAGSTLAVLGRNGAGKSTLLRILATLLRPHAGEVLVFGEALPRRGFAVRGRLGLLAHDPLLYRDLSGRENLGYHARLHGVGAGARRGAARRRRDAGAGRRAGAPALAGSGAAPRGVPGRAPRPAAAAARRASGQSRPVGAELVSPLIGRAAGATRVLTSHDPQAALAEADLVLGLEAGRAAFVTSPDKVDPAAVKRLYA